MVIPSQGMADKHGIRSVLIKDSISFVGQRENLIARFPIQWIFMDISMRLHKPYVLRLVQILFCFLIAFMKFGTIKDSNRFIPQEISQSFVHVIIPMNGLGVFKSSRLSINLSIFLAVSWSLIGTKLFGK